MLLHGGVMLLLLLAPWPPEASLVKVALLLLTGGECLRSCRRTRRWQGLFVLLNGRRVQWHQAQWQMVSPPWMTRHAVRLSLRDSQGRHERLWLFADGMDNSEWRLLRQQLLSKKEWRDE
nr:protein YgfX [Erwinia persicina]